MFKIMILLTGRNGMTRGEFRDWMLGTHAPLVRRLPGLRRFVVNLPDEDAARYDGVNEIWFDSRAAFDAAYATPAGEAVIADSREHLASRIRLEVTEHPSSPAEDPTRRSGAE
jgi:uncharacterized protein (TIGR02118 family)